MKMGPEERQLLQRMSCSSHQGAKAEVHSQYNGDIESNIYDIQEEPRPSVQPPLSTPFGLATHTTLICSWVYYFGLRFQQCRQTNWTSAYEALCFWILFTCELLLTCPEWIEFGEMTLPLLARKALRRPIYHLVGQSAPMVHILITVCGEDIEVIMDTVVAAATQTYPNDRYQVFILDDAKDLSLPLEIVNFNSRRRSQQLQLGLQPVVYLSREKVPGQQHFYKSGNLRFGLKLSHEIYGSSDLVAALDADMIPEHDWLQRAVPHLILNQELAMVNVPQYLYNIPEEDALAQESNVFQQVSEPLKDGVGCSQCSGSGYVVRRTALDSIGGWPLANIGEDMICSYRLASAGWKSAYIEDEVQFGMAPGSFHSYLAQRIRWSAGSLLLAQTFKGFLGSINASMPKYQRLYGSLHCLKTYIHISLVLPLFLVPVCLPLSTGSSESPTLAWYQGNLHYAYALVWITSKVWKRITYHSLGSTNLSNHSQSRYWTVPCHVYAFCQSLLVDLKKTKFVVSGTFKSPLDERSKDGRKPTKERLVDPVVLMYSTYWIFCSGSLLVSLYRLGFQHHQSTGSANVGLMIRLLHISLAASVPPVYMMFPPTVPPRRSLLAKDQMNCFRSMKKRWAVRGSSAVSYKDIAEALMILICVVA